MPTHGTVTVGHDDLRTLDPARWRRRIAYLPEHPTLLAASLAENLRLADPGATPEVLLAALDAAGAGDLAAGLPDGLDTVLGEGGRPCWRASYGASPWPAHCCARPRSFSWTSPPCTSTTPPRPSSSRPCGAPSPAAAALVVTHRPALVRLADRVVTLRDGHVVDSTVPPGRAGRGLVRA